MGNNKKRNEKNNRRKHQRVSAGLEIKIAEILFQKDDHVRIGKTKNISCAGINCNVNKFIFPFSKVEGVLTLQIENKKENRVPFKGVVVRTEPEKEVKGFSDYNVAIFFNNMMADDRKKIQQYLDSKVSK